MRTLPLLLLTGCLIQPWQGDEADTDTDADTDSDTDSDTDADTDSDTDADTDSDTDTDTEMPVETVSAGTISATTTWTNDRIWRLEGGAIFIDGQLTIQPGTRIEGGFNSALVITQNGRITANGNQTNPIVFTSAEDDPNPGDWGGLALLGNAVTTASATGVGELEGLDTTGLLVAEYGSNVEANNTNNCGSLQFVRIEYAGAEVGIGDELNGLTLAGCGSGTIIRNVHVHNTLDDGVEIFGGTVNLKNVIITRAGDDSLDWDEGWTGKAQFVIIQQDDRDHGRGESPDRGFESDSKWGRSPQSQPIIENVTMIGSHSTDSFANSQRGMVLREDTGGHIANVLMMGFTKEGVDIRDENSSDPAGITHVRDERTSANIIDGTLTLRGTLFYDIGNPAGPEPGTVWAPAEPTDGSFLIVDTANGDTGGFTASSGDDDHSFDELDWLMDPLNTNVFEQDPQLGAPYDLVHPNFIPLASSVVGDTQYAVPTNADSFFTPARFIGAVQPGATTGWYEWTEFPAW